MERVKTRGETYNPALTLGGEGYTVYCKLYPESAFEYGWYYADKDDAIAGMCELTDERGYYYAEVRRDNDVIASSIIVIEEAETVA